MKHILAAALLLIPAGGFALSPGESLVVRFKDGAEVSGVLKKLTASDVTIDIGGGSVRWPLSNVASLKACGSQRTGSCRFDFHTRGDSSGSASPYRVSVEQKQEPQAQPEISQLVPWNDRELAKTTMGYGAGGPKTHHARSYVRHTILHNGNTISAAAHIARRRKATKAEQERFLADLKKRRRALRRRSHTPNEEFYFRLQEAIDRRARGLSFEAKPF